MLLLLLLILSIMAVWVALTYMHENFLSTDYEIVRLKNKLLPVFPELNDVKLMKGQSSYTINKYKIYICLRDKNTRIIYDDNMLVYVILHELAHTKCPEIGHTEMFKKIFFDFLERAENYGLYDPSLPRHANYCK